MEPAASGSAGQEQDDKEKVLVKPEPNDKADETMPDAPQERRLPPKKMKLLEERNGGPAAGSPDALKRSKDEEESSQRSEEPSERSERRSAEDASRSRGKGSDDEAGPRIRVRASTKRASYDGHFAEDSDEEERVRLQQIYEQDQTAATEAGMDIEKMTRLEREELPVSARRQNRYLEIRNHILKLWVGNRREYLSKESAVRAIQKKYAKEAAEIYTFLTRFGFINVGCLANRPTIEAKESVLIIGAGMAGVAAAYHLQSMGYRVKVLEGRDRVGGRCNTSWSGPQGMGVDMGAMVVTGRHGNPVAVFAEQLGIKMHRLGGACPIFDPDGKPVPTDVDQSVEKQFNEMLTEAAKCPREAFTSLGKAIDSLVDKIKPSEVEMSLFNWHLANLEYGCAAELSLVDLHHWDQDDQYELGGGHYLLPTGYGSIVKGIAKHVDVRLSHSVSKVAYTAEGVDVTCENGATFHADYAICTLPLGILKTGKIAFDPPLPEDKQASLQKMGFGVLNKLALYFEKSFWSPTEDYFGITSRDPERRGENFLFWNMQRATGMPVLLALIAGKAAKLIEGETDEKIVDRSLRALRSVFGDLPLLERFQLTRWASDPFAHGSYSYIAEGATGEDYDVLARPLGRLHFAGEHTCREHPATVVGACLSGLREAGVVDRTCRGPIQDLRDEDASEDGTPGHRRRRIRQSDANVPSFRKREGDATPAAAAATTPPSVRAAPLFSLPSTEVHEAATHMALPTVDVESIRRNIQAQPPPRPGGLPPPSVAPPPTVAPVLLPFRPGAVVGAGGSGGAPSPYNLPAPGLPHAFVPRPAQVTAPGPGLGAAPSQTHNGHPASANGEEAAKKFREAVSELVIKRLKNRYMPQGRIASKEDFKHLARKLTHIIVEKEQKRQSASVPALTEEVRKKAKRLIDEFFSKLDGPYHSDKTGPLQLSDPLQKQRDERKQAKRKAAQDAKDKKHKHKHKHHSHSHYGHGNGNGSHHKHADVHKPAEAEPEAPPMSPVDDAPTLAALPSGFVPMTITTDQNGAANGQ